MELLHIAMDFLHVAPLFLIVLSLFSAQLYRLMTKKSVNSNWLSSILLVLCSVGIISGEHVHHGELLTLVDPCFGYAATLIGVAVKIVRQQVKVKA